MEKIKKKIKGVSIKRFCELEGKTAVMWKKAFNLGETPLVPLSSYPPLISLIIPPSAGSLGDF